MNNNISSVIEHYKRLEKTIDTYKSLNKAIPTDLEWKQNRIISLMDALEDEINDINKYLKNEETQFDKESDEKINKIMTNMMPLMTYMWFKD